MRALVLTAAALLVALDAPGAGAQAIPNITAAKTAASNAAAKANAHIAAEQAPSLAANATAPRAAVPSTGAGTRPVTPAQSRTVTRGGSATAATAAKPDSAKGAGTSVTKRGVAGELTFQREVYAYPGAGRRDPFMSLMKSGDLRPLLSDLKLVTVLYDPTGRNSVAILRDLSTKDQYRVKVGQQLGRMRVAQIQPKQLVLTIEEFGFSRQETLALTDISTARTQ